ncbi:MAG: GNAT family N-acetyltransferase [Candidatus Hermodarchaeota archaeon]
MKDIIIDYLSLHRDRTILREMDEVVDWNISAHPLANLVDIARGGAFVARYQEINVGMVYAFPYEGNIGWIGFLVVKPPYRNQGIGTALMNKAIDFLHQKKYSSIGLYATEEGASLYQKLGFFKILTSWRFTIEGVEELEKLKSKLKVDSSSSEIVDFSQVNHILFDEIVSLDAEIFGANRRLIFENRLKMDPWHCTCILKGHSLEAFGMWRLIDNHGFIGPVMGSKSSVFRVLLPRIFLELIALSASTLYLGTDSSEMASWLASLGFKTSERPLLMFLGALKPLNSQMWVICHPAKG